MSASALIAELEAQGIRPLVRGGKLKLAGPKAKLTPDLIERVRAYKAELTDLFGANICGGDEVGVIWNVPSLRLRPGAAIRGYQSSSATNCSAGSRS